ncbi:lysine exporter LysO family protein [Saccharicrinis sp. FJH54]|uniref:lysine exporter LysO family protein n=1 Tax=Saccharicrinis sp. FJH54 TaxID=3344665 RepID=UPI0035D46835
MRDIIVIALIFITGIVLGTFGVLPESFDAGNWSEYALYALLLFVGIGIGSDKESLMALKRMRGWLILIPVVSVIGSLLFALLALPFFSDLNLREVLAVSAGMGYYSLSSILISKLHGETLGTIALVANLIREIFTLLITPFMIKYTGKLTPIAAGGATSMDTTLPVVIRFSGKEYVMISIYSGVVITFLVPVLVTFILS